MRVRVLLLTQEDKDMKLCMCNCRYCKAGRHSSWSQYMITHKKRAARHLVKARLKKGEYENLPEKIGIPYTD